MWDHEVKVLYNAWGALIKNTQAAVAFKVEHSSDKFLQHLKITVNSESVPRIGISHFIGTALWSILGTSGCPANQPMRSLMSSSNEQPIHRCKKIRPESKHRPIHLSPDHHSDRHADWSSTFSAEEAVYPHSQSRDSHVTNLLQFAKPTSHPVKKHINIV